MKQTILTFALFFFFYSATFAGDGFDNNYIGLDAAPGVPGLGGANQLVYEANGVTRAIVFGPGDHTAFEGGNYYIVIDNYEAAYDLGTINSFTPFSCVSQMRSAYFDRVQESQIYYRCYKQSEIGGSMQTIAIFQLSVPLDYYTCYTSTTPTTWGANFSEQPGWTFDFESLEPGDYYFEFFIWYNLDDVGLEVPASNGDCTSAQFLCDRRYQHSNRFLTSLMNTTDPTSCQFNNYELTYAPPTRIKFTKPSERPSPRFAVNNKSEHTDKKVVIQPNPAILETYLNIGDEYGQLYIYSSTGELMLDRPKTTGFLRIETFDWPAGVYYVTVMYDSGDLVNQKLVILRN